MERHLSAEERSIYRDPPARWLASCMGEMGYPSHTQNCLVSLDQDLTRRELCISCGGRGLIGRLGHTTGQLRCRFSCNFRHWSGVTRKKRRQHSGSGGISYASHSAKSESLIVDRPDNRMHANIWPAEVVLALAYFPTHGPLQRACCLLPYPPGQQTAGTCKWHHAAPK